MIEPVRRVHYFPGQVLTAEDLQAEQDYHREMRYLHNRILGYGVVHGLEVSAGDGSVLLVGPGVAIDRRGREIVLAGEVRIDVAAVLLDSHTTVDVTVTWREEPDALTVLPDGHSGAEAFTRWLERPALTLEPPGQGPAESLVLARVVGARGAVTAVDRSGRDVFPGRTAVQGG
ncbi:hypothetical protein BH20ACT5_BH20ACT5_11530 [soil metagenome]